MKPAVYIAFDTETGGIPAECSLLTLYVAALDEDFNIVDEIDLAMKPTPLAGGSAYVLQAEGMSVNKIDIIEHDKIAMTYSQAGQVFRDFLVKNSNNGKTKLVPVGHNVSWDILTINNQLLNKGNFDQYVSWRKLDTGTIAQFFKLCKIIPPSHSGSLGYLADLFEVKFEGEQHTARADTLMCVELLKKMRDSICLSELSKLNV